MEENKQNIDIFQLSNYVRPDVKEVPNKDWVMNGDKNSFYTYIIDRYNGSPTNRAIIDSYAKFIYGKGLMSKQQTQKPLQFAEIQKAISKKDLRNICQDYALFSESSLEVIYDTKGNLQRIKHVPKNQILPNKMNSEGDIEGYWFSLDFNQPRKYEAKYFEKWTAGGKKSGSYIYIISTYQVGKTYFTDPIYMAGLPYAELEERVANFCINYITNGFSIDKIINMNQGEPSEKVRLQVKKAFKRDATGNENAGNLFINWNTDKDSGISVENIEIQDAYQQFEYLSREATQKLLISHKVTSPILFGIKDNTGLGNNANEMEVAFNELMINVIQPMKEVILDALMEITDNVIDLDFIPLRQPQTIQPTQLSKHEHEHQNPIIADALIELGEQITEDWELIDEIEQLGEPKLSETSLNLAKTFSSFPSVASEQDTSLFKIRYKYAGSQDPEREFCAKMIKADKVYRKEDIELAETKVVNAGLGLKGADKYSIWLYKGGVNCKHFWQRQIYLRKGNNSISVNEARKMILDLDPKDRPLAKWQQNDPLVAQPAQDSNNNFRAN